MNTINSVVESVVVFPDRARVTRHGTLALETGIQRIEFADLPLSLQPDSVRASGSGSAETALLGVDTRRVHFAETPSERARALEQQLEQLNDQDKRLSDQQSAAEMQASFAKSLAQQAAEQLARSLARGRAKLEQGHALIEFMQSQLAQAQTQSRELEQARRELARQIAKVSAELSALQNARQRERYVTTVEVEVKRAGELTLELTYMLHSAGWQPLYDVRASTTEGDKAAVQLAYLAQVTQHTGEDWQDVALTLSTARPALASVRPELNPWYIDTYAPPPPPTPLPRAAQFAAAPAQANLEMAAPARQTAMHIPSAQVNSTGASVTFQIAQRVSVPSDGSPHKVPIAALDLQPQFDFVCVPKLAEAVYRRATIRNTSEVLLLPGALNLFVDGDFVGSSALELIAPNETFELTLGVADRITVERQLYARDVDKKFIGDRRRVRFGYEIELRNLRAQQSRIELLDQLPVARHEQIKVKLEAAEPKPSEQSDLNELKWVLTLAPDEQRVVRFDFSVEHPTSMVVTGLP